MRRTKKYRVSLCDRRYGSRVYGYYPAKSPEEAVEKMFAAQEKYHPKELMGAHAFHVKRGFKEWIVPRCEDIEVIR